MSAFDEKLELIERPTFWQDRAFTCLVTVNGTAVEWFFVIGHSFMCTWRVGLCKYINSAHRTVEDLDRILKRLLKGWCLTASHIWHFVSKSLRFFNHRLKTCDIIKHVWFDHKVKTRKRLLYVLYDHRTQNNQAHGSVQQLHQHSMTPWF